VFEGDPGEAYQAWSLLTALDWRPKLADGGLLDQPEALQNDVLSIEFMWRRVKESLDD
jgi:hypothetical protein